MPELLDVEIRQQIYLEGVKNVEQENFDPTLEAIAALLALMLTKRGVETLGELSKNEIRRMMAALNRQLSKTLNKFQRNTILRLQEFLSVELGITKGNFENITGKKVFAFNYKGTKAGNRIIWDKIAKGIVPGVGLDPLTMYRNFSGAVMLGLKKLIYSAYADNLSVKEAILKFTGTKANEFKDGLYNTFRNQFAAINDTAIQYISSFLAAAVSRLFFDRYQWVSVLDSRTTDICRSRNGKIYDYATGPQPPAHFRCRSRTVAVTVAQPAPVPASFLVWANRQPAGVQNDIFGKRQANALRKGDLTETDVPKFANTSRLTLEEYKSKRSLMLS